MPRITSILTSRFLINLQEVKQRLAGSIRSISGELEFRDSTSGGFFESFGGQISFDGGNIGDDDEVVVEAMAEGAAEAVEVTQG